MAAESVSEGWLLFSYSLVVVHHCGYHMYKVFDSGNTNSLTYVKMYEGG